MVVYEFLSHDIPNNPIANIRRSGVKLYARKKGDEFVFFGYEDKTMLSGIPHRAYDLPEEEGIKALLAGANKQSVWLAMT